MNIIKKKYKQIKIVVNIYYLELVFILVNIFQQQKLMKKVILTETIHLRKKDKKHQKKKLGCKFIRINTSNAKNGYDLDYEVGNVEAFIDELKKKKTRKKLENEKEKGKELKETLEKEAEIKELKDGNKKLKKKIKNSATNQITNNFGKIIIKN